jgi:HNH endonuclease
MAKQLPLHNGGFALVDDDVYEKFKDRKWYQNVFGYAICNGGSGRKDRRTDMLHQLIVGKAPKPKVTDHINGDILDNRRENLRFVSRKLNNLNSSKRKWIGIHQGRWRVRFKVGKMMVDVAGIATEAEAQSIVHLLKGSLMYHELTKGG